MNELNNSIEPLTTINTNSKNKRITILTTAIIGSLVIGFVFGRVTVQQKNDNKSQPAISIANPLPKIVNADPRALLDPIETLKSPLFIEWNGTIDGIVAKKNNDSFVLEKDGRQLTVYLQQSLTGFYKESKNTAAFPAKITYNDVILGDRLRGGVTISRSTLDNDPTHHIFANVFTVVQNVQSK